MRKSKKRHSKPIANILHLFSTILIAVTACANISLVLLLLTCGLCTFISPDTAPRLGFFCLFYPIFAVVNLLFIPLWLFIRWRFVIIPIAGIIFSAPFTQSYCPVHLFGTDEVSDSSKVVKLMSFNSHYLFEMELDGSDTCNTFLNFLRRDTFDIVAIQEGELNGKKSKALEDAMRRLGYSMMKPEEHKYHSNYIFTRLKPIGITPISMPTQGTNHAVAYTMMLDNDTLTLLNIHLESYSLQENVKQQYIETLHQLNPDSTKSTGLFMVNLMKPMMKIHGQQIDSILEYITPLVEKEKMVILCGDFNDSPVSYVCRRARSVLTDTYRESGWGTGFTYHEKAMPFRIDHIFTSTRFKPVKTWVESSILESDHYPLATILEVLPKKGGYAE